MGKAQGLFGNFSGKIGNLVGFAIKNPATNQVQGVRAYQPTVSNPKSEPQAIQRMKMTAAVNFYRQLTEVLNNAWQGQKYGTRSRNYFMSLAMSQAEGIPFVDKGDKHFYPGQYPVSQGSLPSQAVTAINGAYAVTTLGLSASALAGTWGELSQDIINKNFGVKDGDKITFIAVGERNGEFSPIFSYVILNTESTETADDIWAQSSISTEIASSSLAFGFAQMQNLVAAAVIVSRYPSTAGGSWLRSSATMFCSATYISQFMGAERYAAAIATYRKSESSATSDWYLNEGLTPGGGSIAGGDSNLQIVAFGEPDLSGVTLENDLGQQGTADSMWLPAILVMSDGTGRVLKTSNSFVGSVSDGICVGAQDTNTNAFITNTANLNKLQTAFRSSFAQYSSINVTGYLYKQDLSGVTELENRP